MLTGTAGVDALAAHAPTIATWLDTTVTFTDVVCFQLTAEMHNAAREAVLPPSLHPTTPAALSLQVWAVGDSPWGAFGLAVARATCRSGVRARGFTSAAYASTAAALEALRANFGMPCALADVALRHGYDGSDASVQLDGRTILAAGGIDPDPMGPDDVQYTGTLNLAHTPNGLRLVQLEAHHQATRVERLTPRLTVFDAPAWGNPLLDPYRPVSASVALETVEIPPIRFVCSVTELAFTGTEPVAA